MKNSRQTGFTLVEVAIVLLIVAILLGYTVALFPRQQELKQYRAVDRVMDEVVEAIIGFAQVNGRLPCPAQPDGLPNGPGTEDINVGVGCNTYAGFVPMNTLGLDGRFNTDSLLVDPWGNPYRYYVTDTDFDPLPTGVDDTNNISDFTSAGEMRAVGLVDSESDGYIDLDGRYLICDDAGDPADPDDQCANEASQVFGRYRDGGGVAGEDRYAGAPFVLLSMGKNWNEVTAGDELENSGATATSNVGVPSGNTYLLKDVAGGETTFVRRRDGMADDFDDVVRWVSPSVLFSRMIQADQLP